MKTTRYTTILITVFMLVAAQSFAAEPGVGQDKKDMFQSKQGQKAIFYDIDSAYVKNYQEKLQGKTGGSSEINIAMAGQALIKIDPRKSWENPFGSLKPVLNEADICFTNFEMAVNSYSNIPVVYKVVLGAPAFSANDRPGNTGGPHSVSPDVMEFLASLNFNLMSLANNHAWDLGDNGIIATIDAADANGVIHAGTGRNLKEAGAPAYITVKGVKIALIAATTSRDERDLILPGKNDPGVNGVWLGLLEDRERNIVSVREAAQNADFVIYYHHFQIDSSDVGNHEGYGHEPVYSTLKEWQESYAKAIIDAGASIYIGNGEREFAGVEIYNGCPIFYQVGGLCYQGLQDIGMYDPWVWKGLLLNMLVRNNRVRSIEFIPLILDEGREYRNKYSKENFLKRRGFPEIAKGDAALEILRRFRNISSRFGADVQIENDRGYLNIR